MNTSSSEGRETLTERIGTSELGEQARHELLALGDAEGDRALGDRGVDPEALAQRGDRRGVVVGRAICTRSLPTLAFSASGCRAR